MSQSFDSPFSNPFATASNDAGAPTPQVASAPLAAPDPAAADPSPVAVAALSPAAPAPTNPIRSSAAQPVTGFGNGWSAVGGSPIVVADGDTLDSLSRRYGVPPSAMLKTNGLSSAAQVHGGVRLVVPVYDANGRAVAEAPAEKAKRVASADARDPAPVKRATAKKSAHPRRPSSTGLEPSFGPSPPTSPTRSSYEIPNGSTRRGSISCGSSR